MIEVERSVEMTKLLERAFVEVSKLPQQEQDTVATWILEELASERRWEELFAKSPHALEQLAEEALAEFRAGRTQVLDPDNL
jgi:DNA-binding protein H-NS